MDLQAKQISAKSSAPVMNTLNPDQQTGRQDQPVLAEQIDRQEQPVLAEQIDRLLSFRSQHFRR